MRKDYLDTASVYKPNSSEWGWFWIIAPEWNEFLPGKFARVLNTDGRWSTEMEAYRVLFESMDKL